MPIIYLRDGRHFEVEEGARLLSSLIKNDVDILHRCGGFARCTTCRVEFDAGEPLKMTEAEKDKLAASNLEGVRLSCQILCETDMTLHPVYSLAHSGLADAGPTPSDEITPEAVWTTKD
ncbi:2Fe-2S iron-sulfur cluster-binding protein [Anaerolineales bacterium]